MMIAGDFNEVLFEGEKRGGNGCDLGSISGFPDSIDCCALKDLGYSRIPFTWSNKRGDEFIEERLDRALANEEWLDLFPSFLWLIWCGIRRIICLCLFMVIKRLGVSLMHCHGRISLLDLKPNGSMLIFFVR